MLCSHIRYDGPENRAQLILCPPSPVGTRRSLICTLVCLISKPILLSLEWGQQVVRGSGRLWLLPLACQCSCLGFASLVVVVDLSLMAGVTAEAGAFLSWQCPAAAQHCCPRCPCLLCPTGKMGTCERASPMRVTDPLCQHEQKQCGSSHRAWARASLSSACS